MHLLPSRWSGMLLLLLLMLALASSVLGHSPLGGKGQGPAVAARGHHQPLKMHKRISYRDGGALALNGAKKKTARSAKIPPRKMIEKPRLRFKGKYLEG